MRVTALLACCVLGLGSAVAGETAAVEASIGINGALQLKAGERSICTLNIGLFEKGWKMAGASASFKDLGKDPWKRVFKIKTSAGMVDGEASFKLENEKLTAEYRFTPAADVALNTLHVSADFGAETLIGGKWTADDKSGEFPKDYKDMHLNNAPLKKLVIDTARGDSLTWTFAEPPAGTPVLLQDGRQWGPSMCARIGVQSNGEVFKKGEPVKFGFTLSAKGGIAVATDNPVTIVAGAEWIPLKLELDIEPKSALDFSNFGFQDAPAGKHGRVIARPDGQFAFEKNPEIARRFYGGNFCFSAQYLTHEEADRVAERLMRLGYNAVRIHHYEGELAKDQPVSTSFNPEKLDQLDYLLAAFSKRGLYITTDLFVSRPVKWKDIGMDKPGNVPMDTFKVLVAASPAAFENWKAFSRALLDHVNPYTKLRYAEDPALAWLSMINEGNFGNFFGALKEFAEWQKVWNEWLAARYPTRQALADVWAEELKADEDLAKANIAFPDSIYVPTKRVRDCLLFLNAREVDMIKRMKEFLRNDLKCNALITNRNAWTNFLCDQVARVDYDYVDDHFYIDHPQFLENPWRLPSKCPNSSPVAGGASGGRGTTMTRLLNKPFTITEYNYSAPGRFRGVGGILTGALGALQGWGGIWRFAYSHNRDNELQPARMDYFNMSGDPLGQASERASFCLYLRGDMKAAPHAITINATTGEALAPSPMPRLCPDWHWAAWVTRVGWLVGTPDVSQTTTGLAVGEESRKALTAAGKLAEGLAPYSTDAQKMMDLLKSKGILNAENPTDPAKKIYQSETGEITINAPEDTMILDTPKTAGGYARAGKKIVTGKDRLTVELSESDATVWVSSLDDQPLSSSKRLLATHLTDLQNTDIRYAEKARQTLLDWGKLPHLVRAGKALVRLKHDRADKLKVWVLSTGGKRLVEVKTAAAGGVLEFTADVAEGAAETGARMLYEIAEQ